MPVQNLVGQRFGRLVVLSEAEKKRLPSGFTKRRWKCICDCGNETIVLGDSLKSGLTKSCGCYRSDRIRESKRKKIRENGCDPKTGNNYHTMTGWYTDGDVVYVNFSNTDEVAMTDIEYVDMIKKYKWRLSTKGYVERLCRSKSIKLHREIINAKAGEIVDHIDGNKLNNRSSNLRIVSGSLSAFNQNISTTESGKAGVTKTKSGKWKATITKDWKDYNLGTYEKLEDAISARKEAEIEFFGEYKRS